MLFNSLEYAIFLPLLIVIDWGLAKNQRLLYSDKPADIAFIGTSMTMCAVDDSLLSELINTGRAHFPETANHGYCRPGRNMHYAILKDLLKRKNP